MEYVVVAHSALDSVLLCGIGRRSHRKIVSFCILSSFDYVQHVGNETLRILALERKPRFDGGNYTEKRQLATEIFQHIRSLDPPGRFLKKIDAAQRVAIENSGGSATIIDSEWEELGDEKAIAKCCQTMRDIARPDRQERGRRREERKQRKMMKGYVPSHDLADSETGTNDLDTKSGLGVNTSDPRPDGDGDGYDSQLTLHQVSNDVSMALSTLAEKAAVEAVEGVVDKALHGTSTVSMVHSVAPADTKNATETAHVAI
jgi:hypothetical protein